MSRTDYFPQLTGVRAVAAFMVYFFHYNPFAESSLLHSFIGEFHIGVSIFFVLSGFLICDRYQDSVALTPAWFRIYMRNRVARVYPMFFLLTTLTFAVALVTRYNLVQALVLYAVNVTFLKGFFNDVLFSGLPQGWTLTVEECFYVSAPFIFVVSKKWSLPVIAIALVLMGVALVVICRQFSFYGLFADFPFMFQFTFFGRCLEFLIGIKLARIMKSTWKGGFSDRLFHQPLVRAVGTTHIGIGLVIALMVGMSCLYDYAVARMFVNNLLLPLCIALTFYGLLTESSGIRWLLGSPLFDLLGKSSYVFYLIHIGVLQTLVAVVVPFTGILGLLARFLTLNVLAILLHLHVEEPLNRMIRKLATFGEPAATYMPQAVTTANLSS